MTSHSTDETQLSRASHIPPEIHDGIASHRDLGTHGHDASQTLGETHEQDAGQNGAKKEVRHFCRGRPHEWQKQEDGSVRCARCPAIHARPASERIEGLSLLYKTYKEIQETRKRIGNQEGADRLVRGISPESRRLSWQPYSDQLEKMEDSIKRTMERNLSGIALYDEFLSKVRGVGPVFSCALIGTIRDMRYFGQASSLWHFFGQHVVDGHAARSESGKKDDYDRELKALCHNLSDSFVRSGGFYRLKYDERKPVEARKHAEMPSHKELPTSKMHIENRTRRWVVKLFLSHLWAAGRELNGLPTREPYPQEYMGHAGFIPWREAVAFDVDDASQARPETQAIDASHRAREPHAGTASQTTNERHQKVASQARRETQAELASQDSGETHVAGASQGGRP